MLERLISMTLAGGLACALLLLFKRLLTRWPKGLYFGCLAALVLFAVPFRPTVSVNLSRRVSLKPQAVETVVQTVEVTVTDAVPHQAEEVEPAPATPSPVARNERFTPQEILAVAWLAGGALVFLRYIVSYLLFRRKMLKNSVKLECRRRVLIVEGPAVSPMLIGFFKPVIVMPFDGLTTEERELALSHELAHWRRGDPLVKLLGAAVNSLHWFNPMAYILVRLLDEACEYAVDDRVLREGGDRQSYGNMLLNMACRSSPLLTENISRNKKQLKRRLELIMKASNKKARAAVSVALTLTLALGCGVLADAAAPMLSSLFDRSYVVAEDYYTDDPLYLDGELYLPVRSVLCRRTHLEDEHLIYDSGRVTLELYTNGNIEKDTETGEIRHLPGQLGWTASFAVGSTELEFDGETVTLAHAPVQRDGVVYCPYELFERLRTYEMTHPVQNGDALEHTHKLDVHIRIYDSMNDECRTNRVNSILEFTGDNSRYADSGDVMAAISRRGLRTQFYLGGSMTDGSGDPIGRLEITLERATRLFSSGRDLEGLFTVKLDGRVLAEGQKGYINNLPSVVTEPTSTGTVVEVEGYYYGTVGFNDPLSFFDGGQFANSARYTPLPTEVKLDGAKATGIESTPSVWIAEDTGSATLGFTFATDETEGGSPVGCSIDKLAEFPTYEISETGFRGEFVVNRPLGNGHEYRVDSFVGTFSILDGNKFSLVSDDGRYIVRGDLIDLPENVEIRNNSLYTREVDEYGVTVGRSEIQPLPEISVIESLPEISVIE